LTDGRIECDLRYEDRGVEWKSLRRKTLLKGFLVASYSTFSLSSVCLLKSR
jgi:hypothetical protein